MDVQTSDGKAALLAYVTGYVTKLRDNVRLLRTTESTVFQQLWPFLIDLCLGEPEMAMAFSGTKLSYCNLTRVKLVPTTEEFFAKHSIFEKYLHCSREDENLTCLQYCRRYNTAKEEPTIVPTSNVVGVHYKYIFNPRFFWEYTIVNTPFRDVDCLKSEHYDTLPENLKSFSYIYRHQYTFLNNREELMLFLQAIGYKHVKCEEFLSLVRGYSILMFRFSHCEINVVRDNNASNAIVSLHAEQLAVYNNIMRKVDARAHFLETRQELPREPLLPPLSPSDELPCLDTSDDSSADESLDNLQSVSSPRVSLVDEVSLNVSDAETPEDDPIRVDGVLPPVLTPVLISGEPGTGKTEVVDYAVRELISRDLSVAFAFATAYQCRQTKLKNDLKNVTCDTVHSLFKVPIEAEGQYLMNWSLMKYDVVVFDEVAMIALPNMEHAFRSLDLLPVPPVVIMLGDSGQQHPLITVEGQTTSGEHVWSSPIFLSKCHTFSLYQQNRCECDTLNSILAVTRRFVPSIRQLEQINVAAIYDVDVITSEHVVAVFDDNHHSMFLCITRNGCHFVNAAIIDHLYFDEEPLARDILMSDGYTSDIYEGMRICITENINKQHHLVNGESAIILSFKDDLITITLSNNSVHFIYMLTSDELKDYYPFVANYCMTIFKTPRCA